MMKFATGTVVRLKSGGPLLTVSSMKRDDNLVSVEWFAGDALQHDVFDPESLVEAHLLGAVLPWSALPV